VRLNRAQQRAMEVRAAETRWDDPAAALGEPQPEEGGATAVATGTGASARARRKPVQRVFLLSRAQELMFIRSDLRRLIMIASVLLVVMLVLLFVVD
jgi:hypothetical protein